MHPCLLFPRTHGNKKYLRIGATDALTYQQFRESPSPKTILSVCANKRDLFVLCGNHMWLDGNFVIASAR